MKQFFPAIVIGGPPHSGKSVLIHALSQVLRHKKIAHYVLRANPDGEGAWANEAEQTLVQMIRQKGEFTERFIKLADHDLVHRPLPFLVDVGGQPREWQEIIFTHCTHGVLLIADNQSEIRSWWQNLYTRHEVLSVADLTSLLHGRDQIDAHKPQLVATVSGLERGAKLNSAVINVLADAIGHIFTWDEAWMADYHLQNAPCLPAYDIVAFGQQVGVVNNRWHPTHLPRLAANLPANQSCAIYGRGPNWLYGFLAAHVGSAEFHQFDARLGWVQPPVLSEHATSETPAWNEQIETVDAYTIVKFLTASAYLSIRNSTEFPVSRPPTQNGIIISGKLPFWLITALVKFYQNRYPWVACYQPQGGAVVVVSKTTEYRIGDTMPVPELE